MNLRYNFITAQKCDHINVIINMLSYKIQLTKVDSTPTVYFPSLSTLELEIVVHFIAFSPLPGFSVIMSMCLTLKQ